MTAPAPPPRWPVIAAPALLLVVVAAAATTVTARTMPRAFDAGMVVTFLVIGLLGSLLGRRRPEHRIGPLLVATSAPIVVRRDRPGPPSGRRWRDAAGVHRRHDHCGPWGCGMSPRSARVLAGGAGGDGR